MKRVSCFSSAVLFFVGIFLTVFLSGCAVSGDKSGQSDKPSQEFHFHTHTVEWPGETLPMIAQWYTGNQDNWKILVNANPDIDADHLTMGDQVFIPLELVKNSKKMPKEFLVTFNVKPRAVPKKSSPKIKQAPDKKEEFQPYGPK